MKFNIYVNCCLYFAYILWVQASVWSNVLHVFSHKNTACTRAVIAMIKICL